MTRLARNMRSSGPKKATNVSLPVDLIAEAKQLEINISQACERGLVADIATKRRERWLAENMEAINGWNDWVDVHGLPLAKYRPF
jgi:antitoxin CcdA